MATPTFNLGASIDAAMQPPVLQGGTNTAGGGAAAAGGNVYVQPLNYDYTNQFILQGDQRRAPTQLNPVTLTPIGPTVAAPIAGPQGTPMNFGDPAVPMGGPMQGTARVDAPVGQSLRVGNRQYPMNQLIAQQAPDYGMQPPMQPMVDDRYPMNGAYPQAPRSAPPFVRAMPQQIPVSPDFMRAQQMQLQIARQAQRNANAPLPMPPQMPGAQRGFPAMMQRLAGSLNPRIGQRNIQQYNGQVQMYNNAMDNQRQWAGVAATAIGNYNTNAAHMSTAEFKEAWNLALKFIQTGSPSDLNASVNFMLRNFPNPGADRDAHINALLEASNGMVDLRPWKNITNPMGDLRYDQGQANLAGKTIDNEIKGATKDDRIAKSHADAQAAQARAEILLSAKDSLIALKQIQAERARFETDMRKKYAARLNEATINNLMAGVQAKERGAMRDAMGFQKNMVDEYFKLQGQLNLLISSPTIGDPTQKQNQIQAIQDQMKAFGTLDRHTGLPIEVVGALDFMKTAGAALDAPTAPPAVPHRGTLLRR